MKSIRFILGTLAIAGFFSFSQSVKAQENGNRDENGKVVRGPYETNRFIDNWFLGVGAGINTVADRNVDFRIGGLATDVNLGKWFTPTVGARIGWQGLRNSYKLKDDGRLYDFHQHYFHADVLWNLTNAFCGYKETRVYNLIPYATFGVLNLKDNALDYGSGVGLLNDFRLCKRVSLFLDLSTLVARGQQYAGGRYVFLPSATAGVVVNLGRTNFSRHKSVTPAIVPLPFTTEEYNAAKNRVAELEKENAALKEENLSRKNVAPDTVYVTESAVEPLSRTFFDIGSSVISDREKIHLDYFAILIANTDKNYTIKGYADAATGSSAVNERISQARANAVKDYLVKNCGIDESRLTAVGQGGTDEFSGPVSNNRVVIIE
ncbi:MAG: OmpA family protein [Coprobacter sp.]|nr:OmpA family protein [Coprobacter sp.]